MPLVTGSDLRITTKTGLTKSGSDVTGWMDQVSGTREFVVPATRTSPTTPGQLNGFDYVNFDANLNILHIDDGVDNSVSPGNTNISYILMRSALNLSGTKYVLDAAGGSVNRSALYVSVDSIATKNATTVLSANIADQANQWMVVTAIHGRDADNFIYINGNEVATLVGGAYGTGTGRTLGARGELSSEGNFDVVEVVEYYDVSTHSQSEIEQNVAYFETEWGLTLLPRPALNPITLNGVAQSGVRVDVYAYDDYTMTTGRQYLETVLTDVDGIPQMTVLPPTGKKLFFVTHLNNGGVLSSAQGKFVSDTF